MFVHVCFSTATKTRHAYKSNSQGLTLTNPKLTPEQHKHQHITHAVTLEITVPGFPPKEVLFYLTKLHPLAKLVLGLFWLRLENPIIDWKALTVFPSRQEVATIGCNPPSFSTIPELCVQDPILAVPAHALPSACQAPTPRAPTQSVLEPYNSQDPPPMVPTHALDPTRPTPASHASAYSTL